MLFDQSPDTALNCNIRPLSLPDRKFSPEKRRGGYCTVHLATQESFLPYADIGQLKSLYRSKTRREATDPIEGVCSGRRRRHTALPTHKLRSQGNDTDRRQTIHRLCISYLASHGIRNIIMLLSDEDSEV